MASSRVNLYVASAILGLLTLGVVSRLVRRKADEASTSGSASAIQTLLREPSPTIPKSSPGPEARGTQDSVTSANNLNAARVQPTDREKSNLAQKYEPLINRLGLQQQQAEDFLRLLLDRANIGRDVTGAAGDTGIDISDDPKLLTSVAGLEKTKIDEQIAALLGPDGYAEYQTFDKDQRSSATLANVQKAFASRGVPLTSAQISTLQNDLTAQGTLEFGVRQVTEKVIASAESYLAPTQLAALREFQSHQQEVVRAKVIL
jgi:hypothetical protein